MTDIEPTVEELRRWSAEDLMGWEPDSYLQYYWNHTINRGKQIVKRYEAWRPDDSTTGQIWMVVEKMAQLKPKEHDLQLRSIALPEGKVTYTAAFADIYHGYKVWQDDDNPCLAILKAAYQA